MNKSVSPSSVAEELIQSLYSTVIEKREDSALTARLVARTDQRHDVTLSEGMLSLVAEHMAQLCAGTSQLVEYEVLVRQTPVWEDWLVRAELSPADGLHAIFSCTAESASTGQIVAQCFGTLASDCHRFSGGFTQYDDTEKPSDSHLSQW